MRYVLTCLVLISVAQWTLILGQDAGAGSTDTDIDKILYDNYKNQICKLVPAFGGGGGGEGGDGKSGGPAWSDVMTMDEVLELAFVNMAYGLTSDSVSHMKSELGWKKAVIDKIALIMKATCLDNVISESFLNAAKNLFLYYMVKMQNSPPCTACEKERLEAESGGGGGKNETNLEMWNQILKSLQTCASGISPISIETSCGKATSYIGSDGAPRTIYAVVEQFDNELGMGGDLIGLDIIIDTVWWMFSTAYARCYAFYYPNEDEILVFFQMFREDFLEPFLNRWRAAGPATVHFPIIFGPYDSLQAFDNTRKCASAAFQYENLAERMLVRPVNVIINNNVERNFKVSGVAK